MKKVFLAALCFAAVCWLRPARSLAVEYELIQEKSWIKFQPKARFGDGYGQFRIFQVKADIDEQNLEKSSLEAFIDAASIDTGIQKRDRHLRSKDFFFTEQYPVATLKITRVEPLLAGAYAAWGELTLRGVTQTVDLPVAVSRAGDGALTLEGETVIRRKAFGIVYDSLLNPIKDEVRVLYRLVLKKKP